MALRSECDCAGLAAVGRRSARLLYYLGVTGQPFPQAISARFRNARHLVLSRYVRWLVGTPEDLFWNDTLCVLVRSGYDRATRLTTTTLVDSVTETLAIARLPGARIMGNAIPRHGDGIVIAHEHPAGVCLSTHRDQTIVGTRTCAASHSDIEIATDGRRILVSSHDGPSLWCFDGWELQRREPFSLETLRRALGDVDRQVSRIDNLGDSVLVETPDTWSRWSWDLRLLRAWRRPGTRDQRYRSLFFGATIVSWHDARPLIHQYGACGYELMEWDLETGKTRSFGDCRTSVRAARSPDGRWLVLDSVERGSARTLELWDLVEFRLVERLPMRGLAADALTFSPDGRQVAIASGKHGLVVLDLIT